MPYAVFFICFDDEMVVIEVFNNEALLFIHDEQDLFYSWVTVESWISHPAQTQVKYHVPDKQDTFFIIRTTRNKPLVAIK